MVNELLILPPRPFFSTLERGEIRAEGAQQNLGHIKSSVRFWQMSALEHVRLRHVLLY